MRPHLWTLFLCALIGTIGLSNEALAWPKHAQPCAPERFGRKAFDRIAIDRLDFRGVAHRRRW